MKQTGLEAPKKNKEEMTDDEIKSAVIAKVMDQKMSWETGTVFVTEKVSFETRDLIRTLRKNYWGVFNKPVDPTTGRKKIWAPLTESIVEAALKNIDLDTKDINFRAKKPSSIGMANVVRSMVRQQLDELYFGEHLDRLERNLCIDGTAIWKTLQVKDLDGKPSIKIKPVDLLNFYIDPAADNLQESDIIERAVMSPQEVKDMDGWMDTEDIEGDSNISHNDPNLRAGASSSGNTQKFVEVFEWWGMMPKAWITGKKADDKEMVPGHLVVSGLTKKGSRVHLVELNDNKKGLKPYEEVHYSKVAGRWLGRGPAERVMMLQLWMNTIINIRINRSYVSQLGIFKIRKNSGLTPQMVSRLAANGALTVKNMDDIEQFVMQEASQASYADEDRISNFAQRVTAVFETATGESLPASTSATSAVIQQQSSRSSFVFVKEGIGMFLQRWLKRHAMPIIQKRITPGEIVRATGEIDELREVDKTVINHLLYKEMQRLHKEGKFFNQDVVEKERKRLEEKFKTAGKDRYIKIQDKVDLTVYDVQVFITNEEIDKGTLLQNLTQTLQMVGSIPNIDVDPADIVRQIFDVLGLDLPTTKQQQQVPEADLPPELAQELAARNGAPPERPGRIPNEQQVFTQNNTL